MIPPKLYNNFQTRIIEGSRKEKERRIREALINSGKHAAEQLEDFGLTLSEPSVKLKFMKIDTKETDRIIKEERKKASTNAQNGIFCLKFVVIPFGIALFFYFLERILRIFT